MDYEPAVHKLYDILKLSAPSVFGKLNLENLRYTYTVNSLISTDDSTFLNASNFKICAFEEKLSFVTFCQGPKYFMDITYVCLNFV